MKNNKAILSAIFSSILFISTPIISMEYERTHSEFTHPGIFLTGCSPSGIFEDILLLSQAKMEYHLDMAQTSQDALKQYPQEMNKRLREMYGYEGPEVKLSFETALEDHTKWSEQCNYVIELINDYRKCNGNKNYLQNLIHDCDEYFLVGTDFYKNAKSDILKNHLLKSVTTNISRNHQRNRGYNSYYAKSTGSDFITKHTIKEYSDFIENYSNFSSKLIELKKIIELIGSTEEYFLSESNIENKIIYHLIFNKKNPVYIELPDAIEILNIWDPNANEIYKEAIARHGKIVAIDPIESNLPTSEVTKKSKKTKIHENKSLEVKRATEEKDILTDTQHISPTEFIVTSPEESFLNFAPNADPILIELKEKEQKGTELNIAITELKTTAKPNTSSPQINTRKKGKKRQNQKVRTNNNTNRTTLTTETTIKESSIEVFQLPIAQYLSKDHLETLHSIVNCEKNIKWKDLHTLITSKNGFNGQVLKNKGGSARTIVFIHPFTNEKIIFTIHKPHKSGKGSASILYLALTKRIKTKLENYGLFDQK